METRQRSRNSVFGVVAETETIVRVVAKRTETFLASLKRLRGWLDCHINHYRWFAGVYHFR